MPITGVPGVIAAIYNTSAGQVIAHNTITIIDFGTKVVDTHDAVTTGAAWKFTAPDSGFYQVSVQILFTKTTTWVDAEAGSIRIFLEGAIEIHLDRKDNYGSASDIYMHLNGTSLVYLEAGEYIDIRTTQKSGAALALHDSVVHNRVTIVKYVGG